MLSYVRFQERYFIWQYSDVASLTPASYAVDVLLRLVMKSHAQRQHGSPLVQASGKLLPGAVQSPGNRSYVTCNENFIQFIIILLILFESIMLSKILK